MIFALVLVGVVGACLGGALAFVIPGTALRISALRRFRSASRRSPQAQKGLTGVDGPAAVLIEGTLRSDDAEEGVIWGTAIPADEGEAPGPRAVSLKAPSVWLELPDGAALIDEEACILHGSVEISPAQPIDVIRGEVGELAAELCSIDRCVVRCLQAGDRVQAWGRVERAPELSGPARYRTSGGRYRLVAPEPDTRIELASLTLAKPFMRRRRRIAFAAASAVVFCALSIGVLLRARPEIATAFVPEEPAPWTPSLEIAAHKYEEGAAHAEREHLYEMAAHAYFMAGNMKDAARMFVAARQKKSDRSASWNELDAYIATRRFEEASRVVSELSGGVYGGRFCLRKALEYKVRPEGEPFNPFEDKIDHTTAATCALAMAAVSRAKSVEDDLSRFLTSVNLMFPREDRHFGPSGKEMDARVAAALLFRDGRLSKWPFSPPLGPYALSAQGPYFQMPMLVLEAGVFADSKDRDPARELDQKVMSAIWYSFLGDHYQAATMYRDALRIVGLGRIEPTPGEAPGNRFSVRPFNGDPLDIQGKRREDAMKLASIGAALSLRAREPKNAAQYVSWSGAKDDPKSPYAYLVSYLDAMENPRSKTELAFISRESGRRRDLLSACFSNQSRDFFDALAFTDGQGLWPLFGVRPEADTDRLFDWARGSGPACHEHCGYYGLLSHWAVRRAAAQTLGSPTYEEAAARRLSLAQRSVDDPEILVLLYVSARLSQMD